MLGDTRAIVITADIDELLHRYTVATTDHCVKLWSRLTRSIEPAGKGRGVLIRPLCRLLERCFHVLPDSFTHHSSRGLYA
jgi:hypothetical protein